VGVFGATPCIIWPGGGIEYIEKQIADDHCQRGMKDVEFFSRSMPKPHMSPRAARRWQEQHRFAKEES
jgi:hypothetical protein